MLRFRRCCLLLAVLLAFLPRALAAPIDVIVGRVNQSSYQRYLDDELYTHLGDNRRGRTGAEHDPARDNIFDIFQSFGLNTTLHSFDYLDTTYYNVIGTLAGATNPDQIYVLGAHYDSVAGPGADDDASGVAGVLEAARVLSQSQFDATLTFIAFDFEEYGLIGSRAYALDHSSDDIRAMIQLDMIAYNPTGPDLDKAWVYYAQDNSPLTQALRDALQLYGGIDATVGQEGRSDHVWFDNMGFDAALTIEYRYLTNPSYHSAADSVDTPGYIDYAYATKITRGVVGYLASAAMLQQTQVIPEPCSALLLSTASGWLLRMRRRRRRRAAA